jgi:hypothetical protein
MEIKIWPFLGQLGLMFLVFGVGFFDERFGEVRSFGIFNGAFLEGS